MAEYVRTATDLAHAIEAQLTDALGPIDLPPGTVVTFSSRLLNATIPTVNAALATVVEPGALVGDANRGVVSYSLTSPDVQVPGIYFVRWQVNTPDQPVDHWQTYPEDGSEVLVLLPGTQSMGIGRFSAGASASVSAST